MSVEASSWGPPIALTPWQRAISSITRYLKSLANDESNHASKKTKVSDGVDVLKQIGAFWYQGAVFGVTR